MQIVAVISSLHQLDNKTYVINSWAISAADRFQQRLVPIFRIPATYTLRKQLGIELEKLRRAYLLAAFQILNSRSSSEIAEIDARDRLIQQTNTGSWDGDFLKEISVSAVDTSNKQTSRRMYVIRNCCCSGAKLTYWRQLAQFIYKYYHSFFVNICVIRAESVYEHHDSCLVRFEDFCAEFS